MLIALSASALVITAAHAIAAGHLNAALAGTYADAYNASSSLAASCSCIGMGG
jgi:hypothetical protein